MSHRIKSVHFKRICRRIIIILSIAVLGSHYIWTQDIDFSLYKYNPLFLNPANTGNYYGSWRIGANYRNQWAATTSPFITASASLDKRFKISNQDFAAGILFINDEAGVGGISYNKLYGSFSYSNSIGKNHFLGGVQVGYVFGSVNSWYNWNQTTGDYTAPNEEQNFGENTSFPDINAGILWKSKISRIEPVIGIALSHINTPSNSFLSSEEGKETIKYTAHIDLRTNISDRVYFTPGFAYFSREGSSLTYVGTDIGYKFPGNLSTVKSIFAGVYLRNGILENADAINLLIGTTVGRLDINIGYDMSISKLSESSGSNLGAFEVAVIYRIVGVVLNSYSIPCERY